MPHSPLIQRFEGQRGKRLLVDALSAQWLVGHDRNLAEALANAAELRELTAGEVLIAQGDSDNDIYFVLAGSLSIVVNGREVAIRTSGYHVGEMALIDPSLRRTATNTAREQTLVARVQVEIARLANMAPRLREAAKLAVFKSQRAGIYAHVFASAFALALGPFQFVRRLRAYQAIRARDVATHRRWMIRNFALTFAAVTLRLRLPASVVAGVSYEIAYAVIAWLCWLPNLLAAQLVLNQTTRGAT